MSLILNKQIESIALPKSEEPENKPNVFCPDCGAVMESYVHQQLIEPYDSYLYLNCIGRCHTERCAIEGISPNKVHAGMPKYCVLLCSGIKDRDTVDLKAHEALAQVALFSRFQIGKIASH